MLNALCEHFAWIVEWFFEFPPNYPNHILKVLALPELKQYYIQSGSLLVVMYQVGVQN
jgi:hypothetical protein